MERGSDSKRAREAATLLSMLCLGVNATCSQKSCSLEFALLYKSSWRVQIEAAKWLLLEDLTSRGSSLEMPTPTACHRDFNGFNACFFGKQHTRDILFFICYLMCGLLGRAWKWKVSLGLKLKRYAGRQGQLGDGTFRQSCPTLKCILGNDNTDSLVPPHSCTANCLEFS